jgi:glutathione S-transferase
MTDTTLDFYGHYLSVPSCKVGLMLSMAAIPYAYHHVDIMSGAHKKPDYAAVNRFAQVPAIVHGGQTICQSDVILIYLAESFGKLDGADAAERIRAREWLSWASDRLWNITRARSQLKFQNGNPAVIEQLQNASRAALGVLDSHLQGGGFIVGAAPTIADVSCFDIAAFAGDADIDISEWPAITAWQARMLALEGCREIETLLPREDRP